MTKALEKAHQVKAIMDLYEYDHAFLSPDGVKRFTKPFGFMGHMYKAKATPSDFKGLTLANGMTEAEGQDAHKVALQIASHLGVDVPDMFGIGSQLRIACTKILEHLNKKAPSPENA